MAYIKLLTDKARSLPWRAQIRRKGHPVMVKMFASKQEAELWANEQERSIRLAGLPMTIDTLKQHTVSEIVIRYRDHVTPTKEGSVEEKARLNKFLKHPMCAKSLAYVSKQDERHVTDYELPPLPTPTRAGVPVVEPVPAVPMVEF